MQFYVSKALSRFEMNIAWKTLIGLTLMYLALPIVGLLTQLDLAALPGVFSHDRIYPALTLSLTSALASTGLIVASGHLSHGSSLNTIKEATHLYPAYHSVATRSAALGSWSRSFGYVWLARTPEHRTRVLARFDRCHSSHRRRSLFSPSRLHKLYRARQSLRRHRLNTWRIMDSSHEEFFGPFTSGPLLVGHPFLLPAHWENSARH